MRLVTRCWIFQANPSHYDIDGALTELSRISWRVPQYTGEISEGDIVLAWRSGNEAGVVGIGRIEEAPRAMESLPDVSRFSIAADDRETTRTIVALRPTPLISRDEVAHLPAMHGHQILKAPMGTVFPLDAAQWTALRALVGEPPQGGTVMSEGSTLPAPFAWGQRLKSVHPLPGGYDGYLQTLEQILRWAAASGPDRDDLKTWIRSEFDVAETNALQSRDFLIRSSILRETDGKIAPGVWATRWLDSADRTLVIALLHSRVRFIGEMLVELREPQSIEQLRRVANSRYGMGWSTSAQLIRRRGWLQSAGMLREDERGKLVATDEGAAIVDRLQLHVPPAPTLSTASEISEVIPDSNPATMALPDESDFLARFRAAASDARVPNRFEALTAELFTALGFTAQHLGGAGNTDVLLAAPLGPGESYRVVIDTKTTSHDAVPDGQIDWITLREHKVKHTADLVAVVGIEFRATRVAARARNEGVALLDVPTLEGVYALHRDVPLGLEAYRALFEPSDTAMSGADIVALAAEEQQRWFVLAAEVVRLVQDLQQREGPVVARDVYWNLSREGDAPEFSVSDIEEVMEVLASVAIGLLRRTESGFKTPGSLAIVRDRLALLQHLILPAVAQAADEGPRP